MTLKDALYYFENIISNTSKRSIIQPCSEFIRIIQNLEKRNLSEKDIKSIELELDILGMNPMTTRFSKPLGIFKTFLLKTFSLSTKGHYTNMGLALGISMGTMLGSFHLSLFGGSLGISLGMCLGMAVGITIGHKKDAAAEAAGTML